MLIGVISCSIAANFWPLASHYTEPPETRAVGHWSGQPHSGRSQGSGFFWSSRSPFSRGGRDLGCRGLSGDLVVVAIASSSRTSRIVPWLLRCVPRRVPFG